MEKFQLRNSFYATESLKLQVLFFEFYIYKLSVLIQICY